MANLVGCFAMSHAPQLMLDPGYWHLLRMRKSENLPLRPELEKETEEVKWTKWRRCMAAIAELRRRLEVLRPDVLIVVGDDQHENILDDNMPPFTVFIGPAAQASTSLRYLNQPMSENRTQYRIDSSLADRLLADLMDNGFDPAYSRTTRYEGGLGHAFARVLKFLMPDPSCAIVPVMVNTYYPPAPAPARCAHFGRSLAAALGRYPSDKRVVLIGSGGLSHTLIDEQLDARFLDMLERGNVDAMAAMPTSLFVDGTSEILNWIVTAAAADGKGRVVDYQPLYRAPTGVGCAMGFAYWDLG